MAVTQYIGSRYVPIFADPIEWSNAKEYEPLTIVTHEGNSFTSKQFVPVGIDIANGEYWALTGNYNGQVEQYRRETADAKAAADATQTDIDTLLPKADFSENNTVKNYIDNSISNLDRVKPFVFDTVVDMQSASEMLYVGAICRTNGFHDSDDDGAAWYFIDNLGIANGTSIISCGNYNAHIINTRIVTPEMFGAYGDGEADDTRAFQAAFDNSTNVILKNSYYVQSNIPFTSDAGIYAYTACVMPKSNTTIQFAGGTIKMQPATNNNPSCIVLANVENVSIIGNGSIYGEKKTHIGDTGENGHCIYILSCENISIEGIELHDSWGDGISMTRYASQNLGNSSNISINNVKIYNCSRCGVSAIAVDNWYLTNSYIESGNRTAPKIGLDIEPNANEETNGTHVIENVTFHKIENASACVGYAIQPNTTWTGAFIFNNIITDGDCELCAPSNTILKVNNFIIDGNTSINQTERKRLSLRTLTDGITVLNGFTANNVPDNTLILSLSEINNTTILSDIVLPDNAGNNSFIVSSTYDTSNHLLYINNVIYNGSNNLMQYARHGYYFTEQAEYYKLSSVESTTFTMQPRFNKYIYEDNARLYFYLSLGTYENMLFVNKGEGYLRLIIGGTDNFVINNNAATTNNYVELPPHTFAYVNYQKLQARTDNYMIVRSYTYTE